MEKWCKMCKKIVEMIDCKEYRTKTGTPIVRGKCKECSGDIARLGKLKSE